MATPTNVKTSTPNVSRHVALTDTGQSPDVSAILLDQSASLPILLLKDSTSKINEALLARCKHGFKSGSKAKHDETYVKETSHTSGADASSSGKCVRIQVPRERGVKELFFKGKVGSTSNDGTVKPEHKCDARATHESIRSSEVESPSSSCASAREQYYKNKLIATLQILQNKEETLRVQAESLALAEARIALLTARSLELKKEIERKGRELKTIRETVQESRIEKCDVSITAQIQESDNQKNIVTTLQNNLGVIEELYRECFYETAKQEGLIEMLRKSYLDVRLMDKEKSDQISRLHNVINTQKWSLDKCQDIASDVENLKVEISNFLNSSNNDSGVWEGSLAEGLTEDLQDIEGQLFRLRELLTGDCTCGLEEENRRLRKSNEAMAVQIDTLRQNILDNDTLENKDTIDKQYLEQIRIKECELLSIRQQLAAVEFDTTQREQTCENMKLELQQTQVLLDDKTTELERLQTQCEQHEETIRQQSIEYHTLRGSSVAAQRRLRAVRTELADLMERCAREDTTHRADIKSLETALWEAQARGASLCEEARRATASVRAWATRAKDLHREQEDIIKQKESQNKQLRLKVQRRQNDTTLTRASESRSCTQCDSARNINSRNNIRNDSNSFVRNEQPSCSTCPRIEGSTTSSSSRTRRRRENASETSASEMGSSPTPIPPQRRSLMKRLFCENRQCPGAGTQEAGVQRPTSSSDQSTNFSVCHRNHVGHARVIATPRDPFCGSVEDVLARVDSAGAALADSLRRWSRHTTLHTT